MELRNLRAFEAVARTLSITAAARELHYAQSTVSEQLQALERELGAELLDRSPRQVRLTAQGKILAGYAAQVLHLVDEARHAVAQPVPELAVGALETVSTQLLPEILVRHRAAAPGTRVRVTQHQRGALHRAVRQGDLDLCLTFGPAPADPALRSEKLRDEPLVVIVPPGQTSYAQQPFLATERGCGFRAMYDEFFPEPPAVEVGSIGTLIGCVAAGMGCALLPMVAVRERAGRGEIGLVELGGPAPHAPLLMTWLDRHSTNPTLVAFQSVLRAGLSARTA
ncbi:LysR family transcriptional regulator [Actinoplanes sp. RD1]|uniref:LysR family transcriptional regulator n=1 Tax=Actinoplanes sp. RD1 TaxID=3064538 RepID=UPI0027424D17|nr:LysR family transcriptional regulator [Actinoplanes sp. RD1]